MITNGETSHFAEFVYTVALTLLVGRQEVHPEYPSLQKRLLQVSPRFSFKDLAQLNRDWKRSVKQQVLGN